MKTPTLFRTFCLGLLFLADLGAARAQLITFSRTAPITVLYGDTSTVMDDTVQLNTPLHLEFTFPANLPVLYPEDLHLISWIYYGSGNQIHASATVGDLTYNLTNVRLEIFPDSLFVIDGTSRRASGISLYATSSQDIESRVIISASLFYPVGTLTDSKPQLPPAGFAFGILDLYVADHYRDAEADAYIHNFSLPDLTAVPEPPVMGMVASLLLAGPIIVRLRRWRSKRS